MSPQVCAGRRGRGVAQRIRRAGRSGGCTRGRASSPRRRAPVFGCLGRRQRLRVMGFIGGVLGYRLLHWVGGRGGSRWCDGRAYRSRSKVEMLFGPDIWRELAGKVVIDFGCGAGRVIGIDNRESVLDMARRSARQKGVEDRCSFVLQCDTQGDAILVIDAFEHFSAPASVLHLLSTLLKPRGRVYVSFGPPWYHPLGGHLFSVFPWAHLIFTERALIRWRSDFKSDGATRFSEVAGGLNQMTIRRFERIVASSPFRLAEFEARPIRPLRRVANRLTREFTTAVVRCK